MRPDVTPERQPRPVVQINECFARDGLQHEPDFVPTATKIDLLTQFARAGFTRIEATSYSNPAKVPAFADASELLAGLPRTAGVAHKATCANVRAVERALADHEAGHGAEEISLLSSASDAHSRTNLGTDRRAQWAKLEQMAELARGRFRLVGVISVAFGCPFEGAIDPRRVAEDVERFLELGVEFITIGDTTGLASPDRVGELFEGLVAEHGDRPLVGHFHDTRGLGVANVYAGYLAGCRNFDSAMGGVGGHPAQIHYGTGNTGNVATEEVVNLFEAMGVDTGLDSEAVMAASRACEDALGRELNSQVARAGLARPVLTGDPDGRVLSGATR